MAGVPLWHAVMGRPRISLHPTLLVICDGKMNRLGPFTAGDNKHRPNTKKIWFCRSGFFCTNRRKCAPNFNYSTASPPSVVKNINEMTSFL